MARTKPPHVEMIPAGDTDTAAPVLTDGAGLRWYQGIDRYAWTVLIICALGWMFDCFDQHLFNLVRQPSVKDLLSDSVANGTLAAGDLDAAAKAAGANLTTVFLLGWAAGGFLFGMLGDKLGRTRTMMITILIYAVFTGLNGFVTNLPQYYICRFLVALGVGGEFAAGASLVAEVWPQRSRAMGLGLLQSLSAVGNVFAAIANLTLNFLFPDPSNWRYVFFLGAIPAVLILWIRRSVHEPEAWHEAKVKAEASGLQVGSIMALFTEPVLRRNTIAGVLLAAAGVGGVWGVGFFSPDLIGSAFKPIVEAAPNILEITDPDKHKGAVGGALTQWRSMVFLVQMIGAGLGMFAFAVVAEKLGRRKALAIFYTAAFLSLQAFFGLVRDPITAFSLAFIMGFCTLAPFSAFAIYFPELYPTRMRSTGVGFCYNAARIVAAAAPFTLGTLSARFASTTDETTGLRVAASIVAFIYVLGFIGLSIAPETKGKPLPE